MSRSYSTLPSGATLKPAPFRVNVPEPDLSDFKQLLRLSKVGPKTYENLLTDRVFGLNHEWFSTTKTYWETSYNWRACEERINSFPNYTASIKDDDGATFTVHFAALFSERADAVPLVLLHGWPGSFLEFLGMLAILKNKYTPKDLPYHVIVPSLPGYAFSTGPPLDKDWKGEDTARIIHKLLVGLGFGSGYVTQGGDIGSFISRILAAKYDACKAMHLNFCPVKKPDNVSESAMTADERKGLERYDEFNTTGNAYARFHGTKPATIGLVLSASPVALLAWIGEKFLVWSDEDPSIDTILDDITLYWLTSTFPRSIYTYRETVKKSFHGAPELFCKKPFGYSWFPMELMPCPVSWAESTGNMVWHRRHTEGGHFAALEKPALLLQDVEDFIKQVWQGKTSSSL